MAFTSTRRKDVKPHEDQSLNEVLNSCVEVATVVGSSSRFHVENIIQTSMENNLKMIYDSIMYLREHGLKVVFDAEHFYDAFKAEPAYAFKTLKTAEEAGAFRIVLCDTNGGSLYHEVEVITKEVCRKVKVPLGIHCHNDTGMAVANSIAAVMAGAVQVQGTINGLGERCGNADLCQLIPTLELKLGIKTLLTSKPKEERLKGLKKLADYVYELAHLSPNRYQPYVGDYAFAHKAGIHIDAVMKHYRAYEHVDPELVGNRRSITVSEIVGKAGIVSKARELGLDLSEESRVTSEILNEVKELEHKGYQLENADATLYLIMLKRMGLYKDFFKIKAWKTVVESKEGKMMSECAIKVSLGNEEVYDVSEGLGPVHAQDLALRKALSKFYPEVLNVQLVNYKVSVIGREMGTASKVRVFMEFSNGKLTWANIGVSDNILEASSIALCDGYDHYLQQIRNPQLKNKQ